MQLSQPDLLLNQIAELNRLLGSIMEDYSNLQIENQRLEQTVHNLEQKVAIITSSHVETHTVLAEQIVDNSQLKHENNSLHELVEKLKHKLEVLQLNLKERDLEFAKAKEQIVTLQAEINQQRKDLPQEAVTLLVGALSGLIDSLNSQITSLQQRTRSSSQGSQHRLLTEPKKSSSEADTQLNNPKTGPTYPKL